jgi:hypothetical protein
MDDTFGVGNWNTAHCNNGYWFDGCDNDVILFERRRKSSRFKIYEGLPVDENLNRVLMLVGDDNDISSGGRALITHKGILEETV